MLPRPRAASGSPRRRARPARRRSSGAIGAGRRGKVARVAPAVERHAVTAAQRRRAARKRSILSDDTIRALPPPALQLLEAFMRPDPACWTICASAAVVSLAGRTRVACRAAQTAPAPGRRRPRAPNPKLEQYKKDVGRRRRRRCARSSQQMIDMVFSFGELGFQEFETSKYLTGILEKNGFTVERRHRRHPDGVDGDAGDRQAGHRARLRHRRHPAGVAEAGRRLPRSDDRGRARATAKATTPGMPLQHHGGARGEEDHGARAPAGHAQALARRRRGAASAPRRTTCAPASSRTSTSALFAHVGDEPRRRAGATATATASSRSSTTSRARARTRPARRGAAARRSTPSS